MRNLTFGDFTPHGLMLKSDEAAIIVVDKSKSSPLLMECGANPFVVAAAGSQNEIEAVKRKYEKDPRYHI